MNLYLLKAKIITFFCCLLLVQTTLFAQSNTKISINQNNITLQEALTEIEKQTGMSVAYNESQLEGKRVSLNIKNLPLEQSLQTILKGTGFSYKLSNEYIMIVPEEKPEQSTTKIKGLVVDESGEPLIGVNVKVRGSSIGTITDIDGKFIIQTKNGDTLEFS